MGRGGLTAVAVWTQVPVANRLVEVNTKTGFSLTAGSYSVRASSTQYGTTGAVTAASNTITISSVTTTRAVVNDNGYRATADTLSEHATNVTLTNATTVTVVKGGATGNIIATVVVAEYF